MMTIFSTVYHEHPFSAMLWVNLHYNGIWMWPYFTFCLSISNQTKTKLSVYRLLTTWAPTAGLHASSSEVYNLNKKTESSITCLRFGTLCDSVEKVRVSVGRRTQSIFVDNVGCTLLSGVFSTMWYRAMAYVKWTYSRSSRVSETIRDLKVIYDFVFLLILWAE